MCGLLRIWNETTCRVGAVAADHAVESVVIQKLGARCAKARCTRMSRNDAIGLADATVAQTNLSCLL